MNRRRIDELTYGQLLQRTKPKTGLALWFKLKIDRWDVYREKIKHRISGIRWCRMALKRVKKTVRNGRVEYHLDGKIFNESYIDVLKKKARRNIWNIQKV